MSIRYLRLSLLEGQGLGNQLWNIASAYYISKYLKFDLQITNFSKFLAKDFLTLPKCIELHEGKPEKILPVYRETLFKDNYFNAFVCDFDDRVLDFDCSTEISGLFQSERYFLGNIGRLGDLFKLSSEALKFAESFSEKTVLNIRGGEYKKHKNLILPDYYWTAAIDSLKRLDQVGEVCVVTDDKRYARLLFPDVQIVSGSVVNCYAALHGARNLVVSNSTFSYFPIMTRPKTPVVVAPAHWARFGNQKNLWVSPANYYSKWKWMDQKGRVLNQTELSDILNFTRDHYSKSEFSEYDQSTSPEIKFTKWAPLKLKNLIKFLLSAFFPRYF